MSDWIRALDQANEAQFERLYRELEGAFSHPFDWMGLMHSRPWWQFRARADQKKVRAIFARHGFLLTDDTADSFFRAPGQQWNEDAGGSVIRRLRQAFQYQTDAPYSLTATVKGDRL